MEIGFYPFIYTDNKIINPLSEENIYIRSKMIKYNLLNNQIKNGQIWFLAFIITVVS